jgi:hypothetical protein
MVLSVSAYIFFYNIYDDKTWLMVCIIFFALNLILPFDRFLKSFNVIGIQESDILDKSYSEVYFLLEGYERLNPVTMKKGKLNYVDRLFEHEIINEDEHAVYTKAIMDNEPVNIVEIYNDNKEKDKNYIQFNSNEFKDDINYMNNNLFMKKGTKHFIQNCKIA